MRLHASSARMLANSPTTAVGCVCPTNLAVLRIPASRATVCTAAWTTVSMEPRRGPARGCRGRGPTDPRGPRYPRVGSHCVHRGVDDGLDGAAPGAGAVRTFGA